MKKTLLFSLIVAFTFSTEMTAQKKKSKDKKKSQTATKPKKVRLKNIQIL